MLIAKLPSRSIAAALIAAFSLSLVVETRGDTSKASGELVHEALLAGAEGDWDKRERILDEVLDSDPNQEQARWHKGFVKHGKAWIHVDQTADLLPIRDVLTGYQQQREAMDDNVEGNLALAAWCRRHKLPEQARAHLTRVIQLSPNHATAHQQLGHRRVDGRWVAAQDFWQSTTETRELQQAFAKWHGKLKRIHAALGSRRLQQRTKALDAMTDVRQPEAIPVIESVFLTRDSKHALLALQVIGGMPEYQASMALARQAVVAPSSRVRTKALELLKDRPLDDYVPSLLEALSSPIQSRVLIDFVDGRLLYRHVFQQKDWEQDEVSIADARYAYQPLGTVRTRTPRLPSGSRIVDSGRRPEELAAVAVATAYQTAENREQMRRRQNALSSRLNQRIAKVLSETTGQKGLDSPQEWWSWWDDENGVAYLDRPTSTRYTSSSNVLVSSVNAVNNGTRCECFAAGTLVWTALGGQPVEEIKVGDLVLSQDVNTGEVSFKPVLQTSTRPAEQLVRVIVGQDQLETTDGHPFWSNGNGWTIARKLDVDVPLYALDAAAKLESVGPGSNQETYNLVVADFHTYFVGKSRVLVHDNTRPRATNAVIPGIASNEAK